jgi:membrane protein implicated in regulation of membrane protease activity
VHHLRNLSIAMVALGVLAVVAAAVGSLSPTWTLAGLLLALAGIVKVVVVALWRGVADLHDPPRRAGDDA